MSLTQIRTESLAAEVTTAIVSAAGLPPKITSIDYPGDDTAADPAGGQTVVIHGANFSASSTIYLNGNQAGVVGYINATALSFTTPAGSPGVVSLYVVNADGGTAIAVPGLLYSGTPSWTTSAGTLGSPYETNSFSVTLQATGDGNVTFAVSAGNTLPSGLTLAANGVLSGTIPASDPTTTYTFYVDAIDAQNQETPRTFSVTYTKDTVTWSSPANGSAYSLNAGAANTITLEANSAAGKSITYSVQSGTLPANLAISGSSITGTPNTAQVNTSVVIRATAADTNRFADQTLYFAITAVSNYIQGFSVPNLTSDTTADYNGYYGTVGRDSSNNIIFVTAGLEQGEAYASTYLFKINPTSGAVIWGRKIANFVSQWLFPYNKRITIDPFDNIYLSLVPSTSGYRIYCKFDTNGTLQWQKRHGTSTTNSAYNGYGSLVWSNNEIIAISYGAASGMGNVTYLTRINANTGAIVIQKDMRAIQTGYSGISPTDIAIQNNFIYIVGDGGTLQFDGFVLKAHANLDYNGTLWQRSPNTVVAGSNQVGGQISGVAVDQTDSVYVVGGRAYNPIRFDNSTVPYVSKFDSNGNVQWTRFVGANVADVSWFSGGGYYPSIEVDQSTNSVYVSFIHNLANSTSKNTTLNNALFLYNFDYNGNVKWNVEFRTSNASLVHNPNGMQFVSNGTLAFSGSIESQDDSLTRPYIATLSANGMTNTSATLQGTGITIIGNSTSMNVVSNNLTYGLMDSNYKYIFDNNVSQLSYADSTLTVSNVTPTVTKVSL